MSKETNEPSKDAVEQVITESINALIRCILSDEKPVNPLDELNKIKPDPEVVESLALGVPGIKFDGASVALAGRLIALWEARLHRERVRSDRRKIKPINVTKNDANESHHARELMLLVLQAFASWEPRLFEMIARIMSDLQAVASGRWVLVVRELQAAFSDRGIKVTKREMRSLATSRMKDRYGFVPPEPAWRRVWKEAGCEELKSSKPGPKKGTGGRPRKGFKEGKSSVTRKP